MNGQRKRKVLDLLWTITPNVPPIGAYLLFSLYCCWHFVYTSPSPHSELIIFLKIVRACFQRFALFHCSLRDVASVLSCCTRDLQIASWYCSCPSQERICYSTTNHCANQKLIIIDVVTHLPHRKIPTINEWCEWGRPVEVTPSGGIALCMYLCSYLVLPIYILFVAIPYAYHFIPIIATVLIL